MSKLKKLKEVYESHPVFWHKYPKLILLVVFFIVAYFIFADPRLASLIGRLGSFSYFTAFVSGIFYSFGFLAPFALGFLIDLSPESMILAAVLGGIGSVLGDLLIFRFIKISFEQEFNTLRKEKPFVFMNKFFEKKLGRRLENFLIYIIAGLLIASPLPDEIGVTILAGITKINAWSLSLISFTLNTLAIYFILHI